MVDPNPSPQLKRKREGAESARKKAKMQSKSKEAATPTITAKVEPISAPKSKPLSMSTPTLDQDAQPELDTLHTNGTHTSTPPSLRKKKNKRKSSTTNKDSDPPVPSIDSKTKLQDASKAAGPIENTRQVVKSEDRKQKKHKEKRSEPWSISSAQGGWFLAYDPIFSADEKFLLLGKPKALEVYATDTSLRVKELLVGGSHSILSYSISPNQSNFVYVADSSGMVTLWDWAGGSKIGRWAIEACVSHLVVVKQPSTDNDLVFAHESGNNHIVNVHALRTGSEASKTELKCILKTSRPITDMQVLLQGKIVVLSTPSSIMIGKRKKVHKTAVQDFEYTWREFDTSKKISTFAAFVRIPTGDVKKDPLLEQRDHLDLAIGDEEGAILLFEDIITTFASIERSHKDKSDTKVGPESLRPKRLHWHRSAVGSLKWSLDGNYLISGGDETVLTIWQLSTGHKQHLPHLTAAIENIVVSPSGAYYGVTLANNSVIVLSTSELQAKTNIAGIQSRRIAMGRLAQLLTASSSSEIYRQVPMDVDPKNASHVIFVVPSSQPRHRLGRFPEPYVQTFDMSNQRAVTRQALTRNNATDPNMGPEGKRILEPNVYFLQLSHDGAWMATVDEWTPPRADMSFVEEGIPAFNEEEWKCRREVYLKIWRRDDKNAQWVLDARIDAPHFTEGISRQARVLDLVADPSRAGFATIGEDRVVRIWRPKTRMRDGLIVRGADRTQGLVTWSLDRMIRVADKLDTVEPHAVIPGSCLHTARLSFSTDGSVLAASISWNACPGAVHIIDTANAEIRRSITEIGMTTIAGMAFVGHHLVVVGSLVVVWDMVMDQLLHCFPTEPTGTEANDIENSVRLATNEEDGTFALAVPRVQQDKSGSKRSTKVTTKVTVFNPDSPKPLWHVPIPGLLLALASAKNSRGYVALDASSSIRIISPTAMTLQIASPLPEPSSPRASESSVAADEEDEATSVSDWSLGVDQNLLRDSENEKPVVRAEQLQQIFETGASHAPDAVRDLFDAVVGLYGRKPRLSAVGAA